MTRKNTVDAPIKTPKCHLSSSRSGMVLVLVLVLAGLITGLTLNLLHLSRIRQKARLSTLVSERLNSAMTDTALELMQRLANDIDLQVDHLEEDWSKTLELRTPGGVSVWASVADQNALVDINNACIEGSSSEAMQEVLMDVLTYFGDFTPIDRIQALTDWVDPDEDGFRETPWYRAHLLETECPNTWLNTLSELEHVDGFSKTYLTQDREVALSSARRSLFNSITVLPGAHRSPAAVNANTATPTVLRAIAGLGNDTWVDYLLTARIASPLETLTPFYSAIDPQRLEVLKLCLTTKSSFFLITVKAFLDQSVSQLQVLVHRDSTTGDVRVLRWIY